MTLKERIKKFLHWETAKKPEVSISSEIYEQLKPFRLPFILLQLVMLVGTLGYIYIEDYSIMEAVFQTAYTFSTTGFGSLREESFSDWAIVFTTTLIITGFVVFTFSIGILLEVVNRGTLFKLLKERKMLYKIARLKNHFVICYHNEYTIELSRELRENHIPFAVIDPNEGFEEIAQKYKYPYYINEEPHTQTAMLKAHLSAAKGVITFSKNIADNIAQISSVRLYERELQRQPYYIISTAENQNDIEKLKKLGADSVISPTKLMSQRVSAMAVRPDMENLLEKFVYKKDTPLDLE
ncbi:MAG: potassium channel family protein, partial [Campylobacterales bacterium]